MSKYSPFDFLNDLTHKKEHLLRIDPDATKQYSPFMVNRGLSYHVDVILWANEMNKRPQLNKDMQYDFLFYGVNKQFRRGSKWSKPEKSDTIELIMEYYKYNRVRAAEVLPLLSDNDIFKIISKLDKGGST